MLFFLSLISDGAKSSDFHGTDTAGRRSYYKLTKPFGEGKNHQKILFFFPKSCEINSTIQKVVPKWLHLKGNTIGFFRSVVKVRGTNYLAISWSRNKAVNLNVASSTVCSLEQNVNVIFSPRISFELVWKWSCAPDRTGIGTVCFWRGKNGIPRKNKNFVC